VDFLASLPVAVAILLREGVAEASEFVRQADPSRSEERVQAERETTIEARRPHVSGSAN
jgi:hypothetical protein